ncbi:MAG: magnesium transporter [Filomicrobium sp.]
MDGSDTSKALRALEALRSAIRDENATAAEAAIEGLSVSDGARTLLHLDQAEQVKAIELIDPEVAARVVEQMPDGSAAALIEGLDPDDAVEIFDELDSDDQADILGEMDDEDAEAILDGMGRSDSRAVRRLMSFPDDTAGGIMMLEVFKFRESETVADVLRRLIHQGEDFERYRGQHPYVVSDKEHLRGVVSLRRLLTSSRTSLLQNVMSPATSVRPETPISLLRDIFDENAFLGLPVVDREGMLLGVVSRDALTEAELERAEADVQKLQGIVNEELRSMPTWLRARRRLSWLTVNIGLNILAASVIALYEDTLAAVIALAVFLPIVSDMSGCSGNQAVAVSLRELSLGVTRPADLGRVWLKEVGVGLINGIALGVLIALAAWLWKGNAYIGLVVGVALALNTVIAVSIGGTVPLILKRFNVDPAVASGPMLTTITDMCGFFLVLSLASVMLPLLT